MSTISLVENLDASSSDSKPLLNLLYSDLDGYIYFTKGTYESSDYNDELWRTDGNAYLRALLHADGKIQYANYQNLIHMTDYLTSNDFADTVALIA